MNQAINVHFLVKCLKYFTSAFQRHFLCLCSRLERNIFYLAMFFKIINCQRGTHHKNFWLNLYYLFLYILFPISKLKYLATYFQLNGSPIKSSPLFTKQSSVPVFSTALTFLFFISFLIFYRLLECNLLRPLLSSYCAWN